MKKYKICLISLVLFILLTKAIDIYAQPIPSNLFLEVTQITTHEAIVTLINDSSYSYHAIVFKNSQNLVIYDVTPECSYTIDINNNTVLECHLSDRKSFRIYRADKNNCSTVLIQAMSGYNLSYIKKKTEIKNLILQDSCNYYLPEVRKQ